MGKLSCLGPASFYEQVKHLKQGRKTLRFGAIVALEDLAMVGQRALNEFHHISNRQRFMLIPSF